MSCECGDRCDLDVQEIEMLQWGFSWTSLCHNCEWADRLYVKVDWNKVEVRELPK